MMNYQKELELFLDYYMPNQSSDIRDAVELDKSFHVINVPKLLAVSGLDESYVLRLTDSWNAWKAAKAQAVPEGFVVVPKEPTEEMLIKGNRLALADKGYRYDATSIWETMLEAARGGNE